jgi:hypothetical protein
MNHPKWVLGDLEECKQMKKKKIMQQKCVISNLKWVIGRFGRMETDEEEEDNATEMCNKQS